MCCETAESIMITNNRLIKHISTPNIIKASQSYSGIIWCQDVWSTSICEIMGGFLFVFWQSIVHLMYAKTIHSHDLFFLKSRFVVKVLNLFKFECHSDMTFFCLFHLYLLLFSYLFSFFNIHLSHYLLSPTLRLEFPINARQLVSVCWPHCPCSPLGNLPNPWHWLGRQERAENWEEW